MNDAHPSALTFGIYPGSAVGDTGPAGPPDRPDQINQALAQLQGPPGRPFTVRAYDIYADPGDTAHAATLQAPAGYDRYLGHGRTLDLVAQYHSRSGDIDGYCAFIEKLIDRHGEHLATLQIGEEPNITGDPLLDGAYPRVTEALIAGVRAAKDKARRSGHPGPEGRLQQLTAVRPGQRLLHRSHPGGRRAVHRRPGLHRPRLLPRRVPPHRASQPRPPPSRASSKPTAATTWPPRGSATFPS